MLDQNQIHTEKILHCKIALLGHVAVDHGASSLADVSMTLVVRTVALPRSTTEHNDTDER